jgi:protein phosphatase
MTLQIPNLSLVVLIGTSGSGKSTFARKHFKATEVLSSDTARGWVSDDESSLDATNDAFEVLHFLAQKRLARGLTTVIDATNVQPEARRPLVEMARRFHVLPVAIVLDVPENLCLARNAERPDRQFGPHVVRNQARDLRRSLKWLRKEGFRSTFVLSPAQIEAATIERTRLWNDRARTAAPSTSSATCTAAPMSFTSCCKYLDTRAARTESSRTRHGARFSWATWSTAARTRRKYLKT